MDNLGKHMQLGLGFTENDVASHATDIFRPIAQEVSMKDVQSLVAIRPISFTQAGPYIFPITQRGDQYIQSAQARLSFNGEIQTDAGVAVNETDGVGLCNLPANSLFQTIEIEIGGKTIPDLQNTHANYKAYVETLLSYGHEARRSHLQASFYLQDTPGHFDDVKHGENTETDKTIDTQNIGLQDRRKALALPWDTMIPLHFDFFNCDRLFPPGVVMNLKLTRAPDKFVIMQPTGGTKTYKVVLSDMKLHIPYISVADSIVSHHKTLIQTKPILLPIKKTEVIVHHFGAGATNVYIPNQYQNRLPKTLIIGMLATDSYNGHVSKNPYYFKNFDVNYVQIIRNNVGIPNEPYSPNWSDSIYMRELRSFFDNTGIGTDDLGSAMTSGLFKSGATLFAFDLTPDHCNGYHWHQRMEGGNIDIDLRFKTAIPSTGITVMQFAVFDALVAIDKDMQVVVSY